MTMQTKKQRLASLQQLGLYIAIPDNLLFGAVFKFHQRTASILYLLNSLWRFVLFFPIAIFSLMRAGMSWMVFHIDRTFDNRYKKLNLIQALWDTFQAVGITGAVVIGTIDYFAPISPLIGIGIAYTFAVLLAASSCYQLALAGYFYYKSSNAKEGLAAAKTNLILSALLASYCVSLTLCMIMGALVIGSTLGMLTTLFSVAFVGYNLWQSNKDAKHSSNDINDTVALLKNRVTDSSKKILKTMGVALAPQHEKEKPMTLENKKAVSSALAKSADTKVCIPQSPSLSNRR